MRINFKNLLYLIVFIGFSCAYAGSYEDFFVAIKRDDARTIQNLLSRGFDPNIRDPHGLPGLYLAMREPSLKAAQALIDWPKTDIEARTEHGENALMIAALTGELDIVQRLLGKGAEVNKPGWTPLHYAATHGHLVIMQLLLDKHAYIDAESPNGTTPLMMAALYGTPEAVRLLLDAGADPLLKNQLGLTAIDMAQQGNRKDALELIAIAIRSRQPRGKW